MIEGYNVCGDEEWLNLPREERFRIVDADGGNIMQLKKVEDK